MPTAQRTSFSQLVADLRRRKGLSHTRMAQSIGCTKASIQQYENAKCLPTLRIYERLIAIHGRQLDVLDRDKLKGSIGRRDLAAKAAQPSPHLADRLEAIADRGTAEDELDRLLLSGACSAAANRLRAGTQQVPRSEEFGPLLSKLLAAKAGAA